MINYTVKIRERFGEIAAIREDSNGQQKEIKFGTTVPSFEVYVLVDGTPIDPESSLYAEAKEAYWELADGAESYEVPQPPTQPPLSIFRAMENHVGQIEVDKADKEIARMESQTGQKWMKSFAPFLEDDSCDHTDPTPLREGCCWIVTAE